MSTLKVGQNWYSETTVVNKGFRIELPLKMKERERPKFLRCLAQDFFHWILLYWDSCFHTLFFRHLSPDACLQTLVSRHLSPDTCLQTLVSRHLSPDSLGIAWNWKFLCIGDSKNLLKLGQAFYKLEVGVPRALKRMARFRALICKLVWPSLENYDQTMHYPPKCIYPSVPALA